MLILNMNGVNFLQLRERVESLRFSLKSSGFVANIMQQKIVATHLWASS
jgi:hypothetical protein